MITQASYYKIIPVSIMLVNVINNSGSFVPKRCNRCEHHPYSLGVGIAIEYVLD